jgi:hypothetical protein
LLCIRHLLNQHIGSFKNTSAMVAEKTAVQALHFEHKLWDNELKFFADEIAIFEHRLEEMLKHENLGEVLPRLEQFQNKFIRQRSVLEEMVHDIKIHEQTLSGLLKAGFSTPEHKVKDHTFLRDRMDSFRKLYLEVKSEFYKFMVQYR